MKPKTYEGKSMKPGGGGRFEKGKDELMAKGMSKERASAIMAAVGREKYGAKKMNQMAVTGRNKANK